MNKELKDNIYTLLKIMDGMAVQKNDGPIVYWKWSEEENKPVIFVPKNPACYT